MTNAISDDDLVTRFAGHPVDHDSAAHYRGRLERRLLINRCTCGTWHHPPRPICPSCWSTDVEPTEVTGNGTIHLAIFLYQGPPTEGVDYAAGPYPVVTVELDEQPGLRFTGTVIGAANDAILIGERVTLDWVERGGTPLPVFRLDRGGA
jgi:uncharacterized OB-fold protein